MGKGPVAEDIRASIEGSFVTGLFEDGRQVAYARAMSDGVFSAFVYDLFVIENARGRGLGKQVTEALLAHPDLTRVRGWMLATRAAHDLYRPFGFDDVRPGRYMDMMREVAT